MYKLLVKHHGNCIVALRDCNVLCAGQAVEAKEGVEIQNETVTLASISYQNFFRSYPVRVSHAYSKVYQRATS